jgi:hypothetical protein
MYCAPQKNLQQSCNFKWGAVKYSDMRSRFVIILAELRNHAPFTLFGALTGIILMILFRNLPEQVNHRLFYVFHPAHVVLSAIVTTAMFKLHSKKARAALVVLIGFVGSLGTATVSDSIIPYIGELLLGMRIDVHGSHQSFAERAHIGFIEGWQIVIPAAILGIIIAYFRPHTKFSHAGHILVSTWASLFHMLMALGGQFTVLKMAGSFVFLFLAVWLPCCFSDIIFPLLFIKSDTEPLCLCDYHKPKGHSKSEPKS